MRGQNFISCLGLALAAGFAAFAGAYFLLIGKGPIVATLSRCNPIEVLLIVGLIFFSCNILLNFLSGKFTIRNVGQITRIAFILGILYVSLNRIDYAAGQYSQLLKMMF